MSPISRRGFLAASALAAPALAVGASGSAAADPAKPGVLPAADVLAADGWRKLAGRKVGVLSNPTGVLRNLTHIVDSMVAAGVQPLAAFGPEHGFRGTSQAGGSEGDYTDPRTGIPVYDAYGATAEEPCRDVHQGRGGHGGLRHRGRWRAVLHLHLDHVPGHAGRGADRRVVHGAGPAVPDRRPGVRTAAGPGLRHPGRPQADRAAARDDRGRAGDDVQRAVPARRHRRQTVVQPGDRAGARAGAGTSCSPTPTCRGCCPARTCRPATRH